MQGMLTRTRLTLAGIAAAAALVTGCSAEPVTSDPTPSTTTGANEPAAATTSRVPDGYTPTATDFTLEVVTLEEQCFGTAGCNVTFTVDVTYSGRMLPDPDRTFTVIYDVTGGSDPLTNRITVNGDQVSAPTDQMIQTDSGDAQLVATVTRVL